MTLSPALLLMATLGLIQIDHRRRRFTPTDADPENAPALRAAMGELLRAGYMFEL